MLFVCLRAISNLLSVLIVAHHSEIFYQSKNLICFVTSGHFLDIHRKESIIWKCLKEKSKEYLKGHFWVLFFLKIQIHFQSKEIHNGYDAYRQSCNAVNNM